MRDTFWEDLTAGKRQYEACLAEVGSHYQLNQTEVSILLFLDASPALDTASAIVEHRRLSKSHVSGSVRTLVERSYLEAYTLPDDRRSVHLRLLPAAEPVLCEARETARHFLSQLLYGFTPEEIVQLKHFSQKVAQNLKRRL